MTHTQAVAGNTAGVAPTDCPGHLAHHESFDDRRMAARIWVATRITIYACDRCGARVVVERIADPGEQLVLLEPQLLNVYDPAEPKETAKRLSQALAAPNGRRP